MLPVAQTDKLVDGPLRKYQEALGLLNLRHFGKTSFSIRGTSFFYFGCFLLTGIALYQYLGGDILHKNFRTYLRFASGLTEPLGLLVLRRKIEVQNSVGGISGMTMQMYAAVYLVRCYVNLPDFTLDQINWWAEQFLGYVSLILVFDILHSVFRTHRSSYQRSLDVVQAKYLISGALFFALTLRPHLHFWTSSQGFWWCFCLYLDVMALLPQVYMMAHGGGVVKAPIAHFVAAVFCSRFEDAWDLRFAPIHPDEYISFSVVIGLHMLHLLMIADFMYYYVKAQFSGAKLVDDLKIGVDMC